MTKECKDRGGFWIAHSIHDQEWIPCKNCDEKDGCEGAKNTEQQLQPENGPVECHHNSCAGWVNGKCPNPGLCREWAVSG